MRHYVLVSYDISNDKRLRKMFKLLRGYGEHVQFSIFLCQLTPSDVAVLSEKIKDIINHKEDQSIMITLGPVEGKKESLPDHWRIMGRPFIPIDNSVMIY